MRILLNGSDTTAADWRPVTAANDAPARATEPPEAGAFPPALAPQLLVREPACAGSAVRIGNRLYGDRRRRAPRSRGVRGRIPLPAAEPHRQAHAVRWTHNDKGLGLVNSRTAEVVSASEDRVSFRLEDGRSLALDRSDPQLRHLDHAWVSTVHAFQGRTVDNVIAAMEANHPHLTTQKSFYVEISRARDRAELVTDDAERLQERLETATGERISALEGIAPAREAPAKGADTAGETTRTKPEPDKRPAPEVDRDGADAVRKVREPATPVREIAFELELEL